MEPTNIMLDLETTGKHPGCKILSIGAVVFGPQGLGAEFYVEAQTQYGQDELRDDPETLAWWDRQDRAVRDRLFDPVLCAVKPLLSDALGSFSHFLDHTGLRDDKSRLTTRVWGNGADFDNAILNVAYKEITQLDAPWDHWNSRCYRTLKGLTPQVRFQRVGLLHNALDDAKSQALHAIRCMEALGLWVPSLSAS